MGGIEERKGWQKVRKRKGGHEACLPNQGEQMKDQTTKTGVSAYWLAMLRTMSATLIRR